MTQPVKADHFHKMFPDILLADYIDQTLLDRDVAEVKAHLVICPACAELATDAAAAVGPT